MFWLLGFLKKVGPERISVMMTGLLIFGFVGTGVFFIQMRNKQAGPELGGPNQTTVLLPKQNSFLYEKREIISYRPNGLHRVQVTGFLRDFTPNSEQGGSGETLLYSYLDDPFDRAAKRKTFVPTASVTKDSHIFLSGVGEQNFVLLNQFSDNITDRYKFLKEHRPFGNFLELNDTVYFTKEDGKLYIARDNKTRAAAKFLFADNFYPRLEGFSADRTALFISKGGEESYAELIRVNLDDYALAPYQSLKGTRNDQVAVCPEQHRAVFIKHALDPTIPPYGKPTGPSSAVILDLESDTATELTSSLYLFENLHVACGAERLAVKENGTWRILTFDGTTIKNSLTRNEDVITLSADGKKAMVSTGTKIALKNLKSGDIEWEVKNSAREKDSEDSRVRYTMVGTLQLP